MRWTTAGRALSVAGPYVVPASGTLDVAYSCSYAAAPSSYSGINTATANWNDATYHTPSGTASGVKAFSLAQLGSTNKTIHVTDTLGGALGTVTGTDAAPFATATFTYSHDFAGVGGTCTDYDNTATITETGQNRLQDGGSVCRSGPDREQDSRRDVQPHLSVEYQQGCRQDDGQHSG